MTMDNQDRQAIEGLFTRLDQVERQAGPRDAEAEAFIRERVGRQPGAPYLMAQTIVMQDYALQEAQARIRQLEQERQEAMEAPPAGGFLSSMFGGASAPRRGAGVPAVGRAPIGARGMAGSAEMAPNPMAPSPMAAPGAGPFGQPGRGGGFLAGAAQTAMGVAGGVLLGNAIAGMFGGDEAKAAEPATASAEPAKAEEEEEKEEGGFFSDWFGGGEEEEEQ